jgi:tRNA modification GTPase
MVITKIDRLEQLPPCSGDFSATIPVIATSSLTGAGLDELCMALRKLLIDEGAAQSGQIITMTANRCRESIRLASAALQRASDLADASAGHELLAAELRTALSELGKVVGAVYTDDLLDRIFSTFCIGK